MARYIRNLRLTNENTLRSVQPPVELAPSYRLTAGGYVENGNGVLAPTITTARTDEYRYNGVFHARLDEFGSRDVTLWHFHKTVWAYQGWNSPGNRQWGPVYGDQLPVGSSYGYAFPEDNSLTKFLTQFVRLPSGILIVPQGARAAVYDGSNVLYLGYDAGPSAPEPKGPKPITYYDSSWLSGLGTGERLHLANGGGYHLNGRALPWSFGTCRLGTVDVLASGANYDASVAKRTNPNGGTLREGMVRGRLQWINAHGDLSPASPPSTAWTCQKEDNVSKERKTDDDELASNLRLQAWWGGIQPGPEGTVGRVFIKTRDLVNSGDPTFYEVPANSSAGLHEFATIPDNVCDCYPDNIPESWLLIPYTPVDPMPVFKLACLFANRLWIANTDDDPGMVRASLPGRWGTLPKDSFVYYADATGSEITGLFSASQGLLVFTERSTFLVTQNDSGEGFQFSIVSNSIGCVSPNSIATLPNGGVVWLGREGFYLYDGENIKGISMALVEDTVRRINPARRHRSVAVVDPDTGEYRCWVPLDRSDFNDFCLVYDGIDWRERNDLIVDCACVTDDERQYVLAAGSAPSTGVNNLDSLFVLDRSGAWPREFEYPAVPVASQLAPEQATWMFRSSWLRASRAHRSGSPVRIRLWLRESQESSFTIRVFRDWRESPAVGELVSTDSRAPDRYATDDPPAFYDTTDLGSQVRNTSTRTERGTPTVVDAAFRRRRPFWSKVDITVPSCEVFCFELEGTGDFEFIGFQYLESSASHHGGNGMTGGKR